MIVHRDTRIVLVMWRRPDGEIKYATTGARVELGNYVDRDTNIVHDPAAGLWYLVPSVMTMNHPASYATVMAFTDRDAAEVAFLMGCTVEEEP